MRFLFGAEFEAGRLELTLLGLGVGFYLGAATLSQALLALDRVGRAAIAWGGSAAIFIGLYAVFEGPQLFRIAAAFAIATGCCAAFVGIALTRGSPRS